MTFPLYPFLFDAERGRRQAAQNMFNFNGDDFMQCQNFPYDFWRSLRQAQNGLRETGSKTKSDKNKFLINVDVKHFTLDELSVKTVDGHVVIRAKHGDKKDSQGWVSRQFIRKYQLPDGCNADNVQCRLSYDGILSISVPLERSQKSQERVVPIIQTGPMKHSRSEVKVDGGDEEEKRECPDEDTSDKISVGTGE